MKKLTWQEMQANTATLKEKRKAVLDLVNFREYVKSGAVKTEMSPEEFTAWLQRQLADIDLSLVSDLVKGN